MVSELIPITFSKIMQSKSYTAVVIGDEHKRFAVYTEPQVGKTLQDFLMDEKRSRPMTHELFFSILENLQIKFLHVVIQDLKETVFLTRIFLEQQIADKRHIIEIDARPSDAICLALMANAPMFCRKEILESAIPFQE
jgi:uncharacterized protein